MYKSQVKSFFFILLSSVLAISIILLLAVSSLLIISLLKNLFSLIIGLISFFSEVLTALVAAFTSGLTITFSIFMAVTTSAFILPSSQIKARVLVSVFISGISTALYIVFIFSFNHSKLASEILSTVVVTGAFSVAFASGWTVGIMSLVEKETNNLGLKLTSVFETVRRNKPRMLKLLLLLNRCVRQSDLDLSLFYATKVGFFQCFRELMRAGANPNAKDSYENTVLSTACELGDTRMIKILLDKGADVEMVTGGSRGTALHQAANWGFIECVEMLVTRGASVDKKDSLGRTPLMLACIYAPNPQPIISLLVGKGKKNIKSNENKTALHYACSRGLNIEFLQNSEELNSQDSDGNSPLHLAAFGGHSQLVFSLLDQPTIKISLLNNQKLNPLHLAAMNGSLSIVKKLFDFKLMTEDLSGHCPFWYSAKYGHSEVCLFFLRKNVFQNSLSSNPLQAALENKQLDIIKTLLLAGGSCFLVSKWLNQVQMTPWYESNKDQLNWIKCFVQNSKPLVLICRDRIRKAAGRSIHSIFNTNSFPNSLKKYLTLEDLN